VISLSVREHIALKHKCVGVQKCYFQNKACTYNRLCHKKAHVLFSEEWGMFTFAQTCPQSEIMFVAGFAQPKSIKL